MSGRAYFDWNASAMLRPAARTAMVEALALAGNASSVHAEGRAVRRLIEEARRAVADLVGAAPRNVVFTSGATEANMLALTPALDSEGRKAPRNRLLVSAIEHPSVLSGGRFATETVEKIPVTAEGTVNLEALARAIASADRPLVSVMLASNETGVIQPIRAIADIVHHANGLLHVDAAQGAGRIDCDMAALGADLLTISAHKLGGPQGAGALILRDGLHIAEAAIRGGGQERGMRAGTENVAAIAGFGAAVAAARVSRVAEAAHMVALRDRLEAGIEAITSQAVIFGRAAQRLPNTTLFAVSGIKAETAIIAFDLKGIAVSSGAACSSGKVQPSQVLAAMGVEPALAQGAVRASLGWTTTEADVDGFLHVWNMLAGSLLKEGRSIAA